MQTVGTTVPRPVPRRLRRRRLSRRRFIRRTIGFMLLAAIVVVGCQPTLRYLGYVAPKGKREVAHDWRVVKIAGDRRSVQIRVDVCNARFAGVHVARAGSDVRLTVFERREPVGDSIIDCVPFSQMPTYVVMLGFSLPDAGRVVGECPESRCP